MPGSPPHRATALRSLLLFLVLLATSLANAGSYSVVYSGGVASAGSQTQAYYLRDDGWWDSGVERFAQASGMITASFTWNPTNNNATLDPAPQKAIVVQQCVTTDSGGSSSNGLGDPLVGDKRGADASGSPIPHYQVKGGASFSVTCSPSVVNGPHGGSLIYSAGATPLKIVLGGVLNAVTDKRLLIGQRLTASVSGAPGGGVAPNTYTWIVGGGPFTSYTPSVPASQFVGYDPPSGSTSASAACNFRSPGAKSVQCSVYIAVMGQTVTLDEQVTAVAPDYQAWAVQGQADFATINENTPQEQPFGMHLWGATYTDPDGNQYTFGIFLIAWVNTPAAFVSQGEGIVQWAQLITKLNSWAHEEGGGYQDVDNPFGGASKLDGGYPYLGRSFSADGVRYFIEDAPGMSLGGLDEAYFTSTHQDYLNYRPAGPGAQLVSLARFDWTWLGHAALRKGDWVFVKRSKSCQYTANFPAQPMWTSVAAAPTDHPRP